MILIFALFFLWASFLNAIAYRLLYLQYFFSPHHICLHCKQSNKFFFHFSCVSWFIYRMTPCCKKPIAPQNSLFEIFASLACTLLWHTTAPSYFFTYFIFLSALLIALRTDIEEMLISRFTTLYLIPFAFLASAYGLLPLSAQTSVFGACFGFFILWITKISFQKLTHKEGLGQGDIDLLAMIGAFTGPLGAWVTVSLGSILGMIITLFYMLITKKRVVKFPFGPFLVVGAIIFLIYPTPFIEMFAL